MIDKKKLYIYLFSVFFVFFSCKREENFSNIPVITFKSLEKIDDNTGIDNKAWLKIEFTDGDGDIGLDDKDTFPPFDSKSIYKDNLFIKFFEKRKGVRTEVILPLSMNVRIKPNITPTGQNKSLKGIIETAVYLNNVTSSYDTVSYDVYLVDRELHKSNVISTPDIVVKKK
jgi:hypothetical protein